MTQLALIELPTIKLLEKFGSGTHAPGSGSAAALMGLIGCRLISTVAAISLRKLEYQRSHSRISFIADKVNGVLDPSLRELFQQDAMVFDEVIKARVARDTAIDDKEKRRYAELALERLREATEIPFQIGDACIELIDYGAAMFDMGFKGARGDTGAAISAAVAGAMAAVFVINLNLKSFRGSEWAMQQRRRCDDFHQRLSRKQLDAFGRVMTLRAEDVSSIGLNFNSGEVTFSDDALG
jgi:formiminotetrahydrofolate cyclodeaminase